MFVKEGYESYHDFFLLVSISSKKSKWVLICKTEMQNNRTAVLGYLNKMRKKEDIANLNDR